MDMEHETARLKIMGIVALVFVITLYFSWKEFKYALFGKVAPATVSRQTPYEERKRYGRKVPMIKVEYSFTDSAGNFRSDVDSVTPDFPLPAANATGQGLKIQYLATASRLSGHSSIVAPIIFFVTLGLIVWQGWKIWRQANSK